MLFNQPRRQPYGMNRHTSTAKGRKSDSLENVNISERTKQLILNMRDDGNEWLLDSQQIDSPSRRRNRKQRSQTTTVHIGQIERAKLMKMEKRIAEGSNEVDRPYYPKVTSAQTFEDTKRRVNECMNKDEHFPSQSSDVKILNGSNRVSQIGQDFVQRIEVESPKTFKSSTDNSASKPQQPNGMTCYFCEKRLYAVEKNSADGFNFHRSCFRCHKCNNIMRIGTQKFNKIEKVFYCPTHADLAEVTMSTLKKAEAERKISIHSVKKAPPTVEIVKTRIDPRVYVEGKIEHGEIIAPKKERIIPISTVESNDLQDESETDSGDDAYRIPAEDETASSYESDGERYVSPHYFSPALGASSEISKY